MALKTKDGTIRFEPSCFKQDSRALGISFVLSGGTQLFAPYPFMTYVQMTRDEEMAFHYTFGIIRVIGIRLKDIFHAVQIHELLWVKSSDRNETGLEEPKVDSVVFEKGDDAPPEE